MTGADRILAVYDEIFNVDSSTFNKVAVELFHYQYQNNLLYRKYCELRKADPETVKSPEQIPFLPITFFKSKKIVSGIFEPEVIFESSGTTGTTSSKHFVKDKKLYEKSFRNGFKHFYGDVQQYCIIGLLPSYLERKNSSLVYMVNDLIRESGSSSSGFYLNDTQRLFETLLANEALELPTVLIGVTYAVLNFAEQKNMNLKHTVVMETGGMKGRREELPREMVHDQLKKNFGLAEIHSEYGMTELLSQAYSRGNGIFHAPAWMKVFIRSEDDPFKVSSLDRNSSSLSGAVNIIDLANIHSCSFIATDDIGTSYNDGSFEILGRIDNSDLRGCGLMVL